jgi:transcriptional regulator with XRE-family HTH domain
MKKRGVTAKGWAERAGVNPNAIYNFLNGRSDSLRSDTQEKLATAEGVPISAFTGELPDSVARTVEVIGQTSDKETIEDWQFKPEERFTIQVPKLSASKIDRRSIMKSVSELVMVERKFNGLKEDKKTRSAIAKHDENIESMIESIKKASAITFVGRSLQNDAFGMFVNESSFELVYAPGKTVLLCEPLTGAPKEASRLIVELSYGSRRRAVVRELRVDERGLQWLWPQSRLPEFQAPLSFEGADKWETPAGESARIMGRVVASVCWEGLEFLENT